MKPAGIIKEGAVQLGVNLTPGQIGALVAYLEELLKWNKKVNLTSIDEPREAAIKHFLDSLALCRVLPVGGIEAIDIGTGAGFPGLVLAVARPEMAMALLDPSRKKGSFMKHVIRSLGLSNVSVLEEKVESLVLEYPGRFGAVFSRAFKDLPLLLPHAAVLLKPGGLLIQSLGPGSLWEPTPGWEAVRDESVSLPFSDIVRRLLVLRKA